MAAAAMREKLQAYIAEKAKAVAAVAERQLERDRAIAEFLKTENSAADQGTSKND
jgi:hypothetical protein